MSGTGTACTAVNGIGTACTAVSGTGTACTAVSGTGTACTAVSGTGTACTAVSNVSLETRWMIIYNYLYNNACSHFFSSPFLRVSDKMICNIFLTYDGWFILYLSQWTLNKSSNQMNS